jgi:short-chain Z-isoprenyl diphosphate synthase
MNVSVRQAVYRWYARRLRSRLRGLPLPQHVAIIMDGNRRWARRQGFDDLSTGHRHGAEHLGQVLGWCEELGIGQVTVFVVSIDNLRKRDAGEVDFLMRLAEQKSGEVLAGPANRWQIRIAGQINVLPDSTARALKEVEEATMHLGTGLCLTLAIGYDGRVEIMDALRSLLLRHAEAGRTTEEVAESLTSADVAAHLYTRGLPDPDLVIRTSGEQRLGGFLLWQTIRSDLYFCEVNWPGFRQVDFLRALRAYAARAARSSDIGCDLVGSGERRS